MKTFLFSCCLVLCLFSTIAAEEVKLEDILKQREQLLTEIVQYQQSQYDTGQGFFEQLQDAKLKLARFQRDSAKDAAMQARHQEEIIALLEQQILHIDAQVKEGEKEFVSLLYAREKLLGAQQKLLEIKASKTNADKRRQVISRMSQNDSLMQ